VHIAYGQCAFVLVQRERTKWLDMFVWHGQIKVLLASFKLQAASS
jgi:hypothetical protein